MSEITNNEVTASNSTVSTNPLVFHTGIVAVSKTKGEPNKRTRVFQGYVTFGFPTLDQVNDSFPQPDNWKETIEKGGVEDAKWQSPVYDDGRLDYLQGALLKSVVANARNKAAQDINADLPKDWEALFTQATSEKFGTVMKLYTDTFTEWLADHSGYTPEQGARVLALMDLRKIGGADSQLKAQLLAVHTRFVTMLEDTSEIAMAVRAIESALAKPSDDLGFIEVG